MADPTMTSSTPNWSMTDVGRNPERSGRAETDPDEGVYVISVAAELLGVHPQTLRGYERQGLLKPTRTPGGTRLYSRADMARARRVLELTAEGLTLTGAAKVIALEQRLAELTRPGTSLVLWRRR